jgi:hypothetical protein
MFPVEARTDGFEPGKGTKPTFLHNLDSEHFHLQNVSAAPEALIFFLRPSILRTTDAKDLPCHHPL